MVVVMNIIIPILIINMLSHIGTPAHVVHYTAPEQTVIIDGDTLISNDLPMWGTTCDEVDVHGSPDDGSTVLSTIRTGERVRLHELSRGVQGWVMIKPAKWIQLASLCD